MGTPGGRARCGRILSARDAKAERDLPTKSRLMGLRSDLHLMGSLRLVVGPTTRFA